jgi:hypothetical protein
MSETAGTSNFAAMRGRRALAEEEWAETTCVYKESRASSFSRSGETISGTLEAYCGAAECMTEESPFSLGGKQTDIQEMKDQQSDAYILFGSLEDGWYLIRAAYYEAGDCAAKLLCCSQGGERSRLDGTILMLEQNEGMRRCGGCVCTGDESARR